MGFTGPPEPARSRPQRVSVITVSIALLAILATLWPAVSAQIYQHVELKDKEERGVARTQYVIAPLCCVGCRYRQSSGCCCARHVLVPVTSTRAGISKTHTRRVTTTRTRYIATVTTTIAVNNGVSLKPTRQFDASSRNWDAPKSEDELFEPLARDAGDVSGLDIQLDKREMCMDCPASANLTRPNGRVGSVSYCCPTKRRTVTVTKPNKTTWIIRTSYVKTTVKATSTVAVRATVEKISGRLYTDVNSNGAFDVAVDLPLASKRIQLVKPAVQRAGNDTQIVAESITGKDGKFTFSALLPPRETLFIVRKDQPSKNLIEIRIDQFGKPFQSDLNAAISSFQCSFTPAAGFGSLSIKDRPELVSKIRNAITDMLAAVQAVWHNSTGSSGEPARLQPQNSTLAKLGINPEPSADCPYPNSGWRLSLRGACGAPTVMAGMKAVKIQIEVVSNKTRCLAQGVQPFRIDVGSYFYVLPPIARHDIVEEASAANGNHATLRGAAEFSQDGQHSCPAGFERNNVTHRPELNDATFHLLFSYWQKAGLNGTCGPFSHEVKDKSTVKVLSSCTKDFDIGSILATSHYLRLFAAVPCTKLGAPNKEWAALIVGNSTIFSYFYDIYKAKRTNITFGPNASEQRNVVPSLRESINKKSGKVVARNLQAAKSLATQPVAPLAPVLPAPSRMSPNPSLFNRGTGLFPRGEDSNAACLTGWCAFVLSALDKAATDNANLLNINIKGLKINLLSFFSPSKFITATGKSICNMMVKGSDLAWWASASGPGAWLSVVDVPVFSDAMSWSDLFTSLPVSNDKYYVLGFYSSTVPGVTYPPTMPSIQVASAINICTGDFLFAFAGLQFEVEWRDPPLTLTVSLDAMGFSIPGSVQASALGFVTSFWAPSGFQTLDITGQMYVQGTISTTFGDPELDPVAIGVSATGLMMLNSDPAKNGWGKADVSFGLQVSTAPSLTLLQGAITIDLSGLASATATLMFNFLSAKNFQLAFQTTFNVALADFLATLPQIGEPISDALGMIFGGLALNGEFDVWISNVEWGLRICMGGAGMFGPLGAAWTLMTTFIPSLPSTIENCYSIGGPMTGSGLPVKMTAYYSGKSFSMYFCKRDSHCPSGYSCNSGICSTIACPSAHPNMQGLLCYDSCRDGYTNVLGVCWETCRSGFVDAGAICVQSVGASCPSGYEKDGGLCYPKCRDGYSGVSGVCWEKCRDGYSDTGAFCTSPAITRGKGCCCYSYLKCRGWKCSWKKSCCDACDDGFRDTGCTCFRSSNTYAKNSYSRSPSSAMYAKNTYTIPAYPLNIKIAGLVW